MKSSLSFNLILLSTCIPIVSAQTLVNGQLFTKALTIVDAPAMNSQVHAGSNLNLAVDVSGNGKLQTLSNTGFDLLEVYLVSGTVNLTVSSGTGLLQQESGSTVKHLDWPIPRCVAEGLWNLTFYETSHINGISYFAITPISLEIANSAPAGPCTENVNSVQQQPQVDTPPATQPLNVSPTTASGGIRTITVGTGSAFPPTVTISPTASLMTYTYVVESEAIVTTTDVGVTQTTTLVKSYTTIGMAEPGGDTSSFIPINASFKRHLPVISAIFTFVLSSGLLLVLF